MENNNISQYGFVDENNVLINTVMIIPGDMETLEKARVIAGAAAAHPLSPNVYLARLGALIWNGTYWEENTNYDVWLANNN